jgi:hypothetical protein
MIDRSKILLRTFLIIAIIIYFCFVVWLRKKNTKVELSDGLRTHPGSILKKFQNYSSWVTEFRERECRIYSQNGEDGILLWLFANIGTINHPPRFVEFGVENGIQCNTRFLRHHLGWQGLMMDGSHQNLTINLHRESISAGNINDLLAKYQTPTLIDLLSIDVE